MSQPRSQTWALSQEANKKKGVCRVCHSTCQLHLKDGMTHRHGSRINPCPGSHKPPLGVDIATQSVPSTQPDADASVNVDIPATIVSSAISLDNASSSTLPVQEILWSPATNGLLKFISKSARSTCAKHLASLLCRVADHPETTSHWVDLFKWGQTILSVPRRGGKRHNLTSCLKKRVSVFPETYETQDVDGIPHRRKLKNDSVELQLTRAITSRLEAGNMKAAIRLLMSDDSIATPSEDTMAKLNKKHPPSTLSVDSIPSPSTDGHFAVTETSVQKAIMSFPAGSSGGPDGLRPQHLKDLIACREAGPELLTSLTAFVNISLAGRCPKSVSSIFFGGRLIALNKKSGDVRPIVIGFTLRRLAAKCANDFGIARVASYFGALQLGVGTPGGCEAAIHLPGDFCRICL